MSEQKRIRWYSNTEIEEIAKQEYLALARLALSEKEAQHSWRYMMPRQKRLIKLISLAVFHHIWNESEDEKQEEGELSYPTQSHGSIPVFQSIEAFEQVWDTHTMVDFQEDVKER